jgi:hypothetical protein
MPEHALNVMHYSKPSRTDARFNELLDPHAIDFMFKARRVFIDEAEKTGNNRF